MKIFKSGELIKASEINDNFSKCLKTDLSNGYYGGSYCTNPNGLVCGILQKNSKITMSTAMRTNQAIVCIGVK